MDCPKVFNDPVHSSIQMPLYCQWIIDTPQFQRLRYIKQLGCTCYVFPGAVHTRFDHSLGVSHLAGKLATTLQRHEPSIQTNEIACVEIAGLCHDLGHGPFSHAFENIIPPDENGRKWRHEEQSVLVFEYLIEKNKLKKKMQEFGIYQQELEFICELILGRSRQSDQKLIRENKFYLYQIVNNSVNGVDVDKWDYFARDALFLGMKSAFDFQRIIPFVRVYDIQRRGGVMRKELCFRDKVSSDLNHMFLTRRRLHYASYQHRVSNIIAIMLRDALFAASEHLKFPGRNGTEYNLLECVKDPEAFCQVNDGVINEIMRSRSSEKGMVKAREILDRIHNRQLYQCIVEIQHAAEVLRTIDPADIKKCVVADDDEDSLSSDEKIWRSENLEIAVSHFDYGKGNENPLLHIPFYKKSQENSKVKARFLQEDKLPADLPQQFEDVTLRIFTKVPGLKRSVLKQATNYFYASARRLFRRRETPLTPLKHFSLSNSPNHSPPPSLPVGAVSPIPSLTPTMSLKSGESGAEDRVGSSDSRSSPAAEMDPKSDSDQNGAAAAGSLESGEPEASVTVVKKLFDEDS
ncbi:deoxynucleoside triphosphate triphosphohydrolase SAMHD1-like [Diadema antillarum]|uniref:deoxynucleoside triphosphate triphosphohydrolase SAMHD1-like n=1 Tax=Diadema antillarum TaxID=105358 RepID=UPI003A89A616